ncbi:hypothetical protein OsI_39042 [Oryza sativa Indica Group]|uniref:Gnk2-homologous domain-containing protein n=1 Tax=Oryza sativa subsp. indica TaxID=39946 RepID=A2ZMJ0_ORYSI|nr:hypothetical protein OsI_39042 [Oryza sativa Indica Group]
MASDLVIFLLFLAVAGPLCETAVGDDTDLNLPSWPNCSSSNNYTGDSQYKKNLDQLLSTLSTSAAVGGWFNTTSVGTGADKVFGLIMCYADCNATECQECLASAPAGIMQVCPGSRTADANYDACLLRYSDKSFFSELTYGADPTIAWNVYVRPYVENMTTMNDMRRQLMSQLAERAGDTKLRLDNGSLPYVDSKLGTSAMYWLAQCTRDLAASECRRCLSGYVDGLSDTFPNTSGGANKGYSCYIRTRGRIDRRRRLVRGGSWCLNLAPLAPAAEARRRPDDGAGDGRGDFFNDEADDFEKGTGPKRFRYDELSVATDFFSDDCKLGEGGFGSKQGRKEYESEVRIISRLRHRNLVQLIGWCHDGSELLLVYELMPNASLDTHLYNANANVLPWPLRYNHLQKILILSVACDGNIS